MYDLKTRLGLTVTAVPVKHRCRAWGAVVTHESGWRAVCAWKATRCTFSNADIAIHAASPATRCLATRLSKRVKAHRSLSTKQQSKTTCPKSPRRRATARSARLSTSQLGSSSPSPSSTLSAADTILPQHARSTPPPHSLFRALPEAPASFRLRDRRRSAPTNCCDRFRPHEPATRRLLEGRALPRSDGCAVELGRGGGQGRCGRVERKGLGRGRRRLAGRQQRRLVLSLPEGRHQLLRTSLGFLAASQLAKVLDECGRES